MERDAEDVLTPREALSEIGRVGGRVRGEGRWASRLFLVFGVGTLVYWPVMHLVEGDLVPSAAGTAAGAAWFVLTAWGLWYTFKQPVYGRAVRRQEVPVTIAYLAGVVGNLVLWDVLAPERGAAAVLVALGLALAASAPCFYGAWRFSRP
jgi:hypothetical protein